MKFFTQDINKSKTQFHVRASYAVVPKEDVNEIREMYEKSYADSYWKLWIENPYTFSKDIQLYDNDPKKSIQKYAKAIADLTIKEWMENNLASVIAYQGAGANRKIVGFALTGDDREAKVDKNERAFYFYYLGVAPSHFKKGIGAELVTLALKNCQDTAKKDMKGFSIKLHTRIFNVPAKNLYEKFGFQPVAGDVTHGHSNKYVCYANHYKPEQEISYQRTVKFAV